MRHETGHETGQDVIDESLDIMRWALGRHDPQGWLTGLASGALGTLAFGITCPLDGIVHLGLWHVLPVPLAALAARVIVPPLIRW